MEYKNRNGKRIKQRARRYLVSYPFWATQSVITVAHTLIVGPSGTIACVLLLEHPRGLGVYQLLAHGIPGLSHHTVVSRPTPISYYGIPSGALFDTSITIKLRFALLLAQCFSDFSLLSSRSSMTISAIIGETGEPIATPSSCL